MRKYNDIYYRPVAMNMVEEDGKIWMALLNRNGICEVDKETWQARICKVFEGEPLGKEFLYADVLKVGEYLVFSPHEASKIALYNITNDLLTYIPLKKRTCRCEKWGEKEGARFWNIFCHQANVYLMGYYYPAIIKIDMKTLETIYITDWVVEIEKDADANCFEGYFSDGQVIVDDVAILPIACLNAVVELDLKNLCTKVKKIDIPVKGINGLSSNDGKHIWIVGRSTNKVICWNRLNKCIKEYELDDEDRNIYDPFYAPICLGSHIYLFPKRACRIYEINTDSDKVSQNTVLKDRIEKSEWGLNILAPRKQNGKLLFLGGQDGIWREYDPISDETKNFFVSLDKTQEDLEQYFECAYRQIRKEDQLISEKKIPLEFYLEKVSGVKKGAGNRRTSSGFYIYNNMH